MHPIDFTTCSIADVIVRSVVCHPSMLVDTLRANARIHFNARDVMHDPTAAQCTQRAGKECREAASLIEIEGEYALDKMTFGQRLATFSAAAKLQCVTTAVAKDIAARDDESRKVMA